MCRLPGCDNRGIKEPRVATQKGLRFGEGDCDGGDKTIKTGITIGRKDRRKGSLTHSGQSTLSSGRLHIILNISLHLIVKLWATNTT